MFSVVVLVDLRVQCMLLSKRIHAHPQLQAYISLSFTYVCEYFTWAAHLIRLHFTGDARCVCVLYSYFWVSGGLGSLISHRQKNKKKARVRSGVHGALLCPEQLVSAAGSVSLCCCVSVWLSETVWAQDVTLFSNVSPCCAGRLK